jgi:hypothetical protein
MDYRVFSSSSDEDENSIEAHVLARAYRAVWRCTYGTEPVGQHEIAGLELVVDYGGRAQTRASASYPDTASAARPGEPSVAQYGESASVAESGQCEGGIAADLWTRVRRFGKRMPARELEQLIAEVRALEQSPDSGPQAGAHCSNRRRDD